MADPIISSAPFPEGPSDDQIHRFTNWYNLGTTLPQSASEDETGATRFFLYEDTSCSFCQDQMKQTRCNILHRCRGLTQHSEECDHLGGFTEFLERNPSAFALPVNTGTAQPTRRGGSPPAPRKRRVHFGSAPSRPRPMVPHHVPQLPRLTPPTSLSIICAYVDFIS